MKYENIEQICEDQLTNEMGAKIFEYTKFKDCQFRVVGDPKQTEMQIINHYFIKGMNMDRSKNPSLNQFKMIEKGNVLRYISKDIDEDE